MITFVATAAVLYTTKKRANVEFLLLMTKMDGNTCLRSAPPGLLRLPC